MAAELAKAEAEKQAFLEIGILPALFAVNREAKRLRDAARKAWKQGDKHWAGEYAAWKRELYTLKDQALEQLVREGTLAVVGYHVFNPVLGDNGHIVGGNFAEVLAADGYRFHRPADFKPDAPGLLPFAEISAKPKGDKEAVLEKAEMAVRGYLQGKEKVFVYEWAPRRCSDDWEDDEASDEFSRFEVENDRL